jgi:signal transduction histidine kinase
VAHEIRNPLNSMRLTLDLLNRRTKRGIACTGEVEDAIRQVDRLNVILSRLLAFGRPPLEDVRTQELGPLVERAVAVVVEQSRQKAVGIQILPIDAQATVDGPQIEQVLVNLLLNALDASPRNGRVEVSGETSNGCVRLRVRDQGPGIPQNSRPRVFDAYYTTKANGTGLGLSVSREIIANHGGSLSFNTGENGTEFWLELPIRRSEA